MSLGHVAARGVAWNMVFGSGARALQLVGTLVITHFIAPDAYGAVLAASITVLIVGVCTTFSFGQYLIVMRAGPAVAFQAAVVHVALGVVAMAIVYLGRDELASWLDSPAMPPYVAGFAVAHLFERVRYVPERLLVRALRFRAVATIHGSGELLYTVVALSLAPRFGPISLVAAALIRSVFTCTLFHGVAPREEWLLPHRIEWTTVRAIFAYGAPVTAAAIADRLATRLDNLIMAKLFGPAMMSQYNLAYSLAEVPVSHVAGHIGEVLMPTFTKMEEAERQRAVVRAAALMSLLVSPLGVGLAAVAPTRGRRLLRSAVVRPGTDADRPRDHDGYEADVLVGHVIPPGDRTHPVDHESGDRPTDSPCLRCWSCSALQAGRCGHVSARASASPPTPSPLSC